MRPYGQSKPRPKAQIVKSHYKLNERRAGTPAMPPANRGRNADSLNDLTNEPLVDKSQFDDSDYSVVVKNRAPPPNSWRWEIYRAGRSSPIGQSPIFFRTMVAANKAGKAALKQLLGKLNT
jgi:hypothetical protein